MAKEQTSSQTTAKPQHSKLPTLPKNARIEKRPLLHAPIASPYTNSSTPKCVYIKSNTPFIAAVKRVRKLLSGIDKRALGKIDLNDESSDRARMQSIGQGREKEGEKVYIKATGKAIERAIQLGIWFGEQEDCGVVVKTGSVGAIDDIVVKEGKEVDGLDDLPESRVRWVSTIEIAVGLK